MDTLFKFFNNPENQESVKSGGALVSRHQIKFYKKTYNRYPEHNHENYDNQKFSNVVDKLHFENELKMLKLFEVFLLLLNCFFILLFVFFAVVIVSS